MPRLKPKHERKLIEDSEVRALCSELMHWVHDNFQIDGREEYFKAVALTSVLFSTYAHPVPDLYSKEMDYCLKYFFLLWYMDDVFEDAIENKTHFKELKRVMVQFQFIWIGKYDDESSTEKFENETSFPALNELFDSMLQLHKLWKKNLPDYEHRVKKFVNAFQLWFDALTMYSVDKLDYRYTEESFKTYRRNVAGMELSIEFLALVHNVDVSDAISKSATMKRLIVACNAIVAFSNDVLGIIKDFAKGHRDSLITFLVREKKTPLDVAVRRVCEVVEGEMIDYDLLKSAILKEFDNDDNLIKYLDILDSVIDGHYMLYNGPRYRSRGLVTLTR